MSFDPVAERPVSRARFDAAILRNTRLRILLEDLAEFLRLYGPPVDEAVPVEWDNATRTMLQRRADLHSRIRELCP